MAVGTLSACFTSIILVLWLNDVIGQGINGRRGAEIRCFTEEDKIEILKAHNDYRRASNSSNMRKMEWNDDLEALSQLFIDQCIFGHNTEGLIDNVGFHHIGENLYVSGGDYYQVKNAVDQWYSEIENYDYDSGDCSGVCGHYTQTVWHSSYALGCGLIWCANLEGISQISSGVLIICNYGPSGNSPLAYPFEKGEACSKCPATASFCSDGLCSATADGSSASSTANKCPPRSSGNTTTPGSVDPGEATTSNNAVPDETTTSGNVDPAQTTTSKNVMDSSTSSDEPNGDENTNEVLENIGIFLFVSGGVVIVSSFLYVIRFSRTNPMKSDNSQPMSGIA